MRFMVIVKASKESEAGVLPSRRSSPRWAIQRGAGEGGVMLAGEGLQPSSKGARVRFSGGSAP